jgi:hypothetical protein
MIAGPILPRTADGLWDAVRRDPERLERGLRLVRRELVLGGSSGVFDGVPGVFDGVPGVHDGSPGAAAGALVVDALGADAVGAPVLLFVALIDRDRHLPARIADAREWFARNASMLAPILDGSGVRVDLPARVFVIGFEFSEACLTRLRREAEQPREGRLGEVAAFRVEGLFVDGVRHVGVVQVLGDAAGVDLGADPESPLAQRARQLADLLAHVDPDLVADGDRYSRVWRLDGTTVIRVERDARRLYAVIPDGGVLELAGDDDVAEACDLAMRRYLAIVRGELVEPQRPEPQRPEPQRPEPQRPEPQPSRGPEPAGRSEPLRGGRDAVPGRGPAAALRRSPQAVDRGTEVTAEEFEVFLADEIRDSRS